MASGIDLPNEILRVFVNSGQLEISLRQVCSVLRFRITSISPEEILQELQSVTFANLIDVKTLSSGEQQLRLNPKVSWNPWLVKMPIVQSVVS